jgi:hypothetical protein
MFEIRIELNVDLSLQRTSICTAALYSAGRAGALGECLTQGGVKRPTRQPGPHLAVFGTAGIAGQSGRLDSKLTFCDELSAVCQEKISARMDEI